jgi:hypothetical protein
MQSITEKSREYIKIPTTIIEDDSISREKVAMGGSRKSWPTQDRCHALSPRGHHLVSSTRTGDSVETPTYPTPPFDVYLL